MNMTELTKIISEEHSLSKSFSTRILQTVLNTIHKELKQGRPVRLRNFGTFQAKKSHGNLRAKFDDSKNFFRERERDFKILDHIKAKLPDIPSKEIEKDVRKAIQAIRKKL